MSAIKSKFYDVAVIGGGIVGVSSARQILKRNPKLKICIVEKEAQLAVHQSKRNSGVVHAGIYYQPKSLKAKFCIEGSKLAIEYCKERNIKLVNCGKLVVATNDAEVDRLHNLHKNALKLNIEGLKLMTKNKIDAIQPGCANAKEAIWSPLTSIVDWQTVTNSFAKDFKDLGGDVITKFYASAFYPSSDFRSIIVSDIGLSQNITTKSLVICAGGYSGILGIRLGFDVYPKIIPFKGSYYSLSDKFAKRIKTNLYPVPDPNLPFLGIHITPRTDGSVIIGPTASLSLQYETHKPGTGFNLQHAAQILFGKSFIKLAMNKDIIKAGIQELLKSVSKKYVTEEAQKLFPELSSFDLVDEGFHGIRAQAVDRDGRMVDDFLIEISQISEFKNVLLVRNCPSPAATSSLAIGKRVADIVEHTFL